MKFALSILCVAAAVSLAAAPDVNADPDVAERYIQAYNGEIQILPALTVEEMPRGSVQNVKAPGGFVFNIEWVENKMTVMRVLSTQGGVCRIRSYAGIYSPILRKAVKDCPNRAIAATKTRKRRPTTPESCFDRAKNPLFSVCFDFDTSKGEIVELRGVTGNQDWTDYSAGLDDRFLATPDAARIARNVLDYQLVTGGWPKNVPMQNKLSARERKALLEQKKDIKLGTIDNYATFAELRFLSRMYKINHKPEYLDGVKKGIGFLLYLQYPNGGWPQCDPAKVGYWHQITYNDNAMVNVMNTLRDVYEGRGVFEALPLGDDLRKRCRAAFMKGVDCILKTQIVQDGKYTLWCQQHDRDTLKPCIGRAFELPAITTLESADILVLLMNLDYGEFPEATVKRICEGIDGAMAWYRANALKGIKIEHNWRRPDGIVTSRLVRVPADSTPPMWCRYYTLDTNRPFTGTRQSTMNFDFSEMERGENMSYMWFNDRGTWLEKQYKKWQEKTASRAPSPVPSSPFPLPSTTTWKGGKGSGGVEYIPQNKDTWENPRNWSNGVPGENDTAVFAKSATIWSAQSNPYKAGKIVLKNNARVALRSNYEEKSHIRPKFRTGEIEGAGTLLFSCAGLEAEGGKTLRVPATVKIVSDGRGGEGAVLSGGYGGRLVVEGDVKCPGKALSLVGAVTLLKSPSPADMKKISLSPQSRVGDGAAVSRPVREIRVGPGKEFTSLQAAYDSIPEHADVKTVIRLAPGKYREKLKFGGDRANVVIIGDERAPAKTVLSWNDTPDTPGPGGKPLGTSGSSTLTIRINDVEMRGVTVENTGTPERLAATHGKEQAGQCVAMKVEGDRCAFFKCRFLGWQDTLYAAGRVGDSLARQYFEDCYIEGSVDFIFGSSIALFNGCHIHTLSRGWVTAAAHPDGEEFGYVFVKCRLTAEKGVTTRLGRPWRPYANVIFAACDFGDILMPEAWDHWWKEFDRDVWRSAEYGCRGGGKTAHKENVTLGTLADFQARLKNAGLEKVADIVAGADGWHPGVK